MAVWVSEIVGGDCKFLRLRSLTQSQRRVNPPNTPLLFLQKYPLPIRFATTTTTATTTTGWSRVVVPPRALDPKSEDQNSTSTQEGDLVYVGKLVVGSFAGAGAIKYGSALFPEITTPNLALALAIILTPVLVAVFLLINESRRTKP